MGIQSKLSMRLQFSDSCGCFSDFDSGPINNTNTSMDQRIGANILVPDATVDQIICLQGVTRLQQLFFWSDQAVQIKLIPYGAVDAATIPMTLMPNTPSFLAVLDIVEIRVSNSTGQQARFVIQGAGVTIP